MKRVRMRNAAFAVVAITLCIALTGAAGWYALTRIETPVYRLVSVFLLSILLSNTIAMAIRLFLAKPRP